ncbi:MAG TPA: TadE/TadG family type IV pilus assembly protein [Pyrinomonadaceae bacterium]|jgi:Flp pilus assembly protein TadG|nr:TadE/TadG family type IV pilus assembly protein [Pyrinomonadaceae bacterium]
MHFKTNKNQRGAALVEFALVGLVFFSVLFGVIEFGRLLWTHNALMDATRKGVRYATLRQNDSAGQLAVKKMVVYGDPNANPATATPVVSGLTTSDVNVSYQNYNGIQLSSKATVSITNYQFRFAIPMVGGTLTMPSYQTSLPGESAGVVPCDYPTTTPLAQCSIIPN